MEKRIYFDLSSLANTSAGSAIYSWEVCHRLMRIAKPLQLIPLNCPFKTVGKKGITRAVNAVLRDTVWQNFLIGREATEDDYFIFPNPSLPHQKFYNRKYAVVIHDLGSWHNPLNITWRGRLLVKKIPTVLEHADKIFAVSEYTAQDVAKEFSIDLDRITIAPNGLSAIYQSSPRAVKQVNGFTLPEKYFLHIGTFEPKKNLSFLLKTYERFRQLNPNNSNPVKLILTGGESWKSSDFFKTLNNSPYINDIIILGRVDSNDLPSLYKEALAFIFPSTFEGFGIPVIEALSQGTPVLINDNSSLTQFAEFGATVFDNFDVEIWANALSEIQTQPRKISTDCVTKLKEYFDWDRTAHILANTIGIV